MNLNNPEVVLDILNIAIDAGKEILKIYKKNFNVDLKADNSPITEADINSNNLIKKRLIEIEKNIPILTEESLVNWETRRVWKKYWLIDPLDGTKEFVKRNGEFTVNIAFVENSIPYIGVIYVPAKKWLYYGSSAGAFKKVDGIIQKLPIFDGRDHLVVVGSRSHHSIETSEYFDSLKKKHGEIEIVSMGSSLKICLVAEGKADIYPRFAPTMEWDTAAGHAIVNFAGKNLIDLKTKKSMVYNQEKLINNWFIVK